MSQPSNLKEQIAAERLKLDGKTPARIELDNQLRAQSGYLAGIMSELTEILGFGSLSDAVSLHLGVSVAPDVRAKSLAISAWSDACFWLAELSARKARAAGVVEDFDKLLAAMPALEI